MKKVKNKVVAGILMASILSSTTAAFAESTTSTETNSELRIYTPQEGRNGGDVQNIVNTTLTNLVTSETITSDEETAIKIAITSAKGDIKTALANLVTTGTITSTQETAIEGLFPQQGENNQNINSISFANQNITTSGAVIFNPQGECYPNIIQMQFPSQSTTTNGAVTFNPNMIPIQFTNQDVTTNAAVTYNSENISDTENAQIVKKVIDKLVTAGIITSSEKIAIESAVISTNGNVKTALTKLIAAGTITSTQEAIIETILTELNDSDGKDNQNIFQNQLPELNSGNNQNTFTQQGSVNRGNNKNMLQQQGGSNGGRNGGHF